MARAARDSLAEMGDGNNPAPSMVSVGDREADIYELLVEARNRREHGVGLLVRCQHYRKLEGQELQLWDAVASAGPAGWVTVAVPARSGLALRNTGLEVRFREVELAVPAHKRKYLGATESIRVTIIELREPVERDGIHWRLLTTLHVSDVDDARRIAKWYARRWQIEVMHRVLKTGCRVERRQMRTMDRMKPMIAIDLVVAVYLLGLIAQSRSRPETPASEWLEPVELQALATYHGLEPAEGERITLSEAVRMIAKLGGHLGRKNDGPPGAEVVWRGLKQLETITRAWLIFSST